MKVVVVGGGPAGLEAARVASLRGHEVTLLERRKRVGGQLALWAGLPGRETVAAAPAWFLNQLSERGVRLEVGVVATRDAVLAEKPDAVIVATGARYSRTGETGYRPQPIPGYDRQSVLTVEQILEHGERPTGKVVVLEDEGMNAAVGVAEILAAAGAEVVLVTRWSRVARRLEPTLELPYVMPRLKNLGVTLLTDTHISEIHDDAVTVSDVWTNNETVVANVAAFVMAATREAENSLVDELEGAVPIVLPVGDAIAPRTLGEATYEGHRFARLLGEPDAPHSFTEAYWVQSSTASYGAKAAVPAS